MRAGKIYYEGTFDINLDVPYDLNPPFENAQDLRKMDKKVLETKVVNEYKKIRQICLNKEDDNIAKLTYDRLKDDLVADYATAERVKATGKIQVVAEFKAWAKGGIGYLAFEGEIKADVSTSVTGG